MSVFGEVLLGLLMLAGLAGVLLPVMPGLLLIWAAGLAWVLLDGQGSARWSVLAVMSALLVIGAVAKYALPARSALATGTPRSTLMFGAAGAVAGFILIPVIGLLIGGVAGLLLGEWRRLGDRAAAVRSTRGVLVAVGYGVLIELVAGLLMILTWLVGTLLT